MVEYEFKVTILKIPIFKRVGSEGIIDVIKPKADEDLEERGDEDSELEEQSPKTKDKISESEPETEEDEKGLIEKYKEFKPILNELKKSKEDLKSYLKNLLKSINLKKLEGNLILGLSDHTTTVKIASWIWSIGAIVNSKKPTLLTVEPRFNEVIIDFEGKLELKINLLLLLAYSLFLLTKKNIRELIKEIYRQNKEKDKEEQSDNPDAVETDNQDANETDNPNAAEKEQNDNVKATEDEAVA